MSYKAYIQDRTEKKCFKCKEILPVESFNKDASRGDGYAYWCKSCWSEYSKTDKRKALNKKHRDGRTVEQKREYLLRSAYNMTLQDYDDLFELQDGKCAICGLPEINKRFCVDHDHGTGEVRGLLCDNCNKALGHFFDNTENMKNAITYLKRGTYVV